MLVAFITRVRRGNFVTRTVHAIIYFSRPETNLKLPRTGKYLLQARSHPVWVGYIWD